MARQRTARSSFPPRGVPRQAVAVQDRSLTEHRPPQPPDAERSAWLYGRHPVAAALANPRRRCRRMAALAESRNWLQERAAAATAKLPRDGGIEVLSRQALETLLPEGAVHQGVALLADPLSEPDIGDITAAAGEAAIVILLDRIADPHNVGAVLRSAAAFGAAAILVPDHGTPQVTGVLAKAASGALERVPLVRVVNLARAIDRLKRDGFWCIGLDDAADRTLASLRPTGRIALALGSEGSGLRRLTRERCDMLARLPTRTDFASLNVSNAAAIALYELARG